MKRYPCLWIDLPKWLIVSLLVTKLLFLFLCYGAKKLQIFHFGPLGRMTVDKSLRHHDESKEQEINFETIFEESELDSISLLALAPPLNISSSGNFFLTQRIVF